jgi:hypothetical protein
MNPVTAYGRMYAEALKKTFAGIAKNAWTLVLPIGLILGFQLTAGLLAPAGMVGGIILALVRSALLSCYIYFVGEVLAHSRVSITEFQRSIGAYFWSIVNLFFVLWIASLVLSMLTRNQGSAAAAAMTLLLLMNVVVFGVLPSLEVIYQKGTYNGLDTLQRAFHFAQENLLPWLLPNLLVAAVVFFTVGGGNLLQTAVLLSPEGMTLGTGSILKAVIAGALLHVVMLFRGNLFKLLDGSSHRQRMFKYKNQL